MVDLVAWDGLSELRTTSWTLTQVGFEGCRPSAAQLVPFFGYVGRAGCANWTAVAQVGVRQWAALIPVVGRPHW